MNMKYNLPDRVLRELSSFARKYSVMKIVLFGSRARGTNTERSDIDIAVYGGEFDQFYWEVKENIHSLLMFDIIQADAAISDELKQEIEKDGVTIYVKKKGTNGLYETREKQDETIHCAAMLCGGDLRWKSDTYQGVL